MTSELAQPPSPAQPAALAASPQKLPDWYPAWARQLAEMYFSGTTCLFTLHGNVHDLLACPGPKGDDYANLSEFLATQVFGAWDIVLHYDVGRGLRALAGPDADNMEQAARPARQIEDRLRKRVDAIGAGGRREVGGQIVEHLRQSIHRGAIRVELR